MENKKIYATLATGKEINAVIDHDMVMIVRCYTNPYHIIADQKDEPHDFEESDIHDISENHDGSILTWCDKSKCQNIYSEYSIIYFNKDCSYMLYGCSKVLAACSIFTKANDNISMKIGNHDVYHMFEGCLNVDSLKDGFLKKTSRRKFAQELYTTPPTEVWEKYKMSHKDEFDSCGRYIFEK